MRVRDLIIPACTLFLLNSCSYEPVELIEVRSIDVKRIDTDSISMNVEVLLHNPNNYRITLTDPDLDLYINDGHIGKAVFYDDLVLSKDTAMTYMVPVAAGFNGQYTSLLLNSLGGILGGKMVVRGEGTVQGKAGLFKRRFPFSFKEDLGQAFAPGP